MPVSGENRQHPDCVSLPAGPPRLAWATRRRGTQRRKGEAGVASLGDSGSTRELQRVVHRARTKWRVAPA